VFNFYEGGWITLVVTGILVGVAIIIKRNYNNTVRLLSRLDDLVHVTVSSSPSIKQKLNQEFDPKDKPAVLLVNGFNGIGLHTLFNVIRLLKVSLKISSLYKSERLMLEISKVQKRLNTAMPM
jgi:hypothetical protein